MSTANHLQPASGMEGGSTSYETSLATGLNTDEYNNSNYFGDAQNQSVSLDPNWAINSGQVPSRGQSQSADPAWQHRQYQQPQQQYQNSHSAFHRQQSDIYTTPFTSNPLNYNDLGLDPQPISSSFPFDPALVTASIGKNSTLRTIHSPYPTTHTTTISPHDLQVNQENISSGTVVAKGQQLPLQQPSHETSEQKRVKNLPTLDGSFMFTVPNGVPSGEFTVIDFEDLVKSTQSNRLHNFVNISKVAYDIPITKTTIPTYVPRKSRNELKALASNDKKLLTKIIKRPNKRNVSSLRGKTGISAVTLASNPESNTNANSAGETTSSEDETSYSSDSSPITLESSPLPAERPTTPLEAVRYDTIRSLWRPKNRSTSSEQIRKALVDFWEVVRTIRDRWKADTAAMKQAEEAKKNSELPLLRDRVKNQRDMMEATVEASLEFGHPEIVRMLGENPSFIFVLYQFLVDRAKENDYVGELSRSAFELLAQCSSLTQETLEKTNMSKIITRFSKRANEEIKSYIDKVQQNAAAASSTRKSTSSPNTTSDISTATTAESKDSGQQGKLNVKPKAISIQDKAVGGTSTGMKRASSGLISGKRTLPAAGSASARANSAAMVKSTSNITNEKFSGNGTSANSSSSPASVSKLKGNQVVAKPTNFFSSLQPALKKNATGYNSNVGMSAEAKQKLGSASNVEKKVSTAPPVTISKTSFSFAQMMADVTKPKEADYAVKEDISRPPETAEEKAKRLRKEERRKLRVSFKPEASLVSVRFFTHDPEEIGHEPQMTRDAGDINGEGRMFKQHKDKLDLEEDEDLPQEESIRDWDEPTFIDFSEIPEGERSKNYRPYGGGSKDPDSPESEAQKRYEDGTLIVVYTHPSDIPPTPREPADPFSGDPSETVELGLPSDEILSRIRKQQAQVPVPDVSAILGILNNNNVNQQQPQSGSEGQTQTELERVFASFSANNQGQQTQQTSFTQPNLSQAPLLSHALSQQQQQHQATSASNPNLQAILAALAVPGQTQNQQPSQQPTVAALQQPKYAGVGVATGAAGLAGQTPNLGALLASLGHTTGASSSSGAYLDHDRQSVYEDPERKRARESGDYDERDGDFNKKRKWNGKPKQQGNWPKPQFVVPCKFFKEGKCTKGALCTFLHD